MAVLCYVALFFFVLLVLSLRPVVQRTITHKGAVHPWLPHAWCGGTKDDHDLFELLMVFNLMVDLFSGL